MKTGRDHVVVAMLLWGIPIAAVSLLVFFARLRNLFQ
jgi:hypothetical protein